jgi:hypothetical protein
MVALLGERMKQPDRDAKTAAPYGMRSIDGELVPLGPDGKPTTFPVSDKIATIERWLPQWPNAVLVRFDPPLQHTDYDWDEDDNEIEVLKEYPIAALSSSSVFGAEVMAFPINEDGSKTEEGMKGLLCSRGTLSKVKCLREHGFTVREEIDYGS